MTTIELEVELDDGAYSSMYDELVAETETPVDEILEQNLEPAVEDLLHKLYQQAKNGGENK